MPDKSHKQIADEISYWFGYGLKIGRVYEDLYYKKHLVEFEGDAKEDDIRERVQLYNSTIGQKV